MFNFFKSLFGIPTGDGGQYRLNDSSDVDDSHHFFHNDFWGSLHNFDNENDVRHPDLDSRGFGFPMFSDSDDMHNYIESLLKNIHEKFEIFVNQSHSRLTWENENNNLYSNDNNFECDLKKSPTLSLRDSFLKTPEITARTKKEDISLDGKVNIEDVENLISNKSGTPNESNSITQYAPNVYSKSIFIRRVRHADGTVETIKKVRDHTGNEETTITQDGFNEPSKPLHDPDNDYQMSPGLDEIPNISIFKKFFPF